MTDSKPYVSTRDLLEKIEELEKKLVTPEPPDMNKIIRAEIDSTRKRTTVTGKTTDVFPRKKGK